jgi:hypothetical protein
MNPINWQIFAWTVGAVSVFVAIAAAYALGHDKGYKGGYMAGESNGEREGYGAGVKAAQLSEESRIGVAERNAEVRGVRRGIEEQKAICSAREKEAAGSLSRSLANEYDRGWGDATRLHEENSEGSRNVAYQNGHRKGFEAGVSHWKRIIADRARDAARRDGKGQFTRKPTL